MARRRVCSRPGCPTFIDAPASRCTQCQREADKQRRPGGSVYGTPGHRRFRALVLQRDPTCVLCNNAPATIADHYPTERRDLVAAGLNPDDPARGRGLCSTCHNRWTARTSPGGWNR